jgi:hypothetical protein
VTHGATRNLDQRFSMLLLELADSSRLTLRFVLRHVTMAKVKVNRVGKRFAAGDKLNCRAVVQQRRTLDVNHAFAVSDDLDQGRHRLGIST